MSLLSDSHTCQQASAFTTSDHLSDPQYYAESWWAKRLSYDGLYPSKPMFAYQGQKPSTTPSISMRPLCLCSFTDLSAPNGPCTSARCIWPHIISYTLDISGLAANFTTRSLHARILSKPIEPTFSSSTALTSGDDDSDVLASAEERKVALQYPHPYIPSRVELIDLRATPWPSATSSSPPELSTSSSDPIALRAPKRVRLTLPTSDGDDDDNDDDSDEDEAQYMPTQSTPSEVFDTEWPAAIVASHQSILKSPSSRLVNESSQATSSNKVSSSIIDDLMTEWHR